MKAYIAVSYSQRTEMKDTITAIKETLTEAGISPFIFVDKYSFDPAQEKQMMEQAMKDISSSDIFIAETSHKAIGIGVEAGYAKAMGKPVIYIRQAEAAHSTTVCGISDFQVIHHDAADLKTQLAEVVHKIKVNGE